MLLGMSDKVQLTPVAISEAMIFVNNLNPLIKRSSTIKIFQLLYFLIQIMHLSVALKMKLKRFIKIKVYKSQFRSLKFSMSKSKESSY